MSKLIDTRGTRVHTAARWKRTTPRKLSKSHSVAAERKGAARSVSTKLREVEFCLFALEEAAAAAGTKGRKEAVLRLAVVAMVVVFHRGRREEKSNRERKALQVRCFPLLRRNLPSKISFRSAEGLRKREGQGRDATRWRKEGRATPLQHARQGERGRKREEKEDRERTRRKKKRHHRPGSSESEQDEGLAKRGVALGSGNPGLPISSLLLIHSNCICSQIYILFSGFPPSIRSSATTTTTTTTKHARVCACLCRRRNVHTHVKRRACIRAEMERTKSRIYILFERVTRRIVSSRSPRRRRSSESLSVPRSVSIFLGKFTPRI